MESEYEPLLVTPGEIEPPMMARKMVPVWKGLNQDPWYRFIIVKGGRGGSKSRTILMMIIIISMKYPLSVLFCREIQRSLKHSSFEYIVMLLRAHGFIEQWDIKRSDSKIICKLTGATFRFEGLRTSDSEQIKSIIPTDLCFVEEATSVSATSLDRLEHSIRGSFVNKKGTIIFALNPSNGDDYVYREYSREEEPREDSLIVTINVWDNPFANEANLQAARTMRERNYEKYLTIFGGQVWAGQEDRVYRNWSEGDLDHIVAAMDLTPMYGVDLSYGGDNPAVAVCTYYINDKMKSKYASEFPELEDYEDEIIYIQQADFAYDIKLDHMPALIAGDDDREYVNEKKYKRWENPLGFKGLRGAKSKGALFIVDNNKTMIDHICGFGLNCVPAKKEAGSVEAGIQFLNKHWIVIHPENDGCKYEFGQYAYQWDEDMDRVKNPIKPLKYNDHSCDATRYSVEKLRRRLRKSQRTPMKPGYIGHSKSIISTHVKPQVIQ